VTSEPPFPPEPAGHPPEAALPTDAPDAMGPTTLAPAVTIGLVALGGALGASARYELQQLIPAASDGFPWATFVINVSGALVLGALLTWITGRWSGQWGAGLARPLLGTGFIGAYTTWSTYMVEVTVLAKDGSSGVALAYLVASLVTGLAAAAVGVAAAQAWAPPPGSVTP